ncbi:M48 family metalloprotease [Nitrococcus mobilis]|uniref:Putative beta-barrel assembly-enhancing protease n=1 Tax=Nitrococcus mobilis Nb-231 TaxID=314278 RepID=A4BPM6_9GAMM|nr:M48 family metalloprotease [Nitrococcus mobilis]EAR22527.1 Peptidase M48, Ste24p [Nitrococcus mobilis Nb-231]
MSRIIAENTLKRLALPLLICVCLSARAGLDLSLPDIGDPASQVMTPTEEQQIGQQMMGEVRRQLPLGNDPEINAYIQDLGARLASHGDAPDYSYHFFIVDSPQINAFAMPGGYIGINTGLIQATRTESELGAVLAHEIAHVTQRHLARQLLRDRGSGWRTAALILAGILIGTQSPQAGSAATMSAMAGMIQQQLTYSRADESEADRVGMQTLVKAHFDPEGMPRFFGRLLQASRYRDEPPAFLSTHPLTERRIADAQARVRQLASGKVFESPKYDLMRARLEVLNARLPEDAVNEFQAQLERSSAKPWAAQYGLALALQHTGEYARARTILLRLLRTHGEYAPYFVGLAEVSRAAKQPEQALTAVREGLSLFPDDYALRVLHVETLLDEGHAQQAQRIATTVVSDHPEDANLWQLVARAADSAGQQVQAQLAMGHYYYLRGDIPSALEQIKHVLESSKADEYQKSRATALRAQWQAVLKQRSKDR